MKEKSRQREIEKCNEILRDKKTKNIQRVAITKYLESLESDGN